MALTTMQKTFAGISPSCSVRKPMTQMMMQLIAPNSQPSQQRRPTKMVDAILNTQER
jgi:hypothetical protein